MIMKNLKTYVFGSFLAFSLLLTSCNKEEEGVAVDTELLAANAQIDFGNELDFNAGVDVASENSSYSSRNSSPFESLSPTCATITVDNATPGVFPKTFTVDFGTGCLHNGITRSGIITVTFSDYFINYGSTMTIVRTNNYYINSRKLEGTVVYENVTTNSSIPKWNRTVTNGVLTTLTGNVFTFSGTRTVQQTAGVGTLTLGDNTYEVLSGNHTVTKANGSTLTVTVVETLIKNYACNYISQGQLNLQGSFLDGILDYGDNTCDNQATYTHSNGTVYNVNL
jgi:hypothetical protein